MFTHVHTESARVIEHRFDTFITKDEILIGVTKRYQLTPEFFRVMRIATTLRNTWRNNDEDPTQTTSHQVFGRRLLKDGNFSVCENAIKPSQYTDEIFVLLTQIAVELQSLTAQQEHTADAA
ncbi:MAG: hypothetical protein B5766_05455 [Candidatus Lumbricidophila eiseniae]|uniref:Uncharacterized protein n=1 Tax=Candidatus Lumbricidiphila eiseniae TaxID=1969409 RepID=A0A2A6FRL0_9MICO|nr:MAG: hypothetical protein B5766_05455 [Candidatus Lumbricidophila eiseniae]